jgi:hypothetical protein
VTPKIIYIIFFFTLETFTVYGQGITLLDSLFLLKTEPLQKGINAWKGSIIAPSDCIYIDNAFVNVADTTTREFVSLKQKLQSQLDTLKAKNYPTAILQKQLDSLNSLAGAPNEKYKSLIYLQETWRLDLVRNHSIDSRVDTDLSALGISAPGMSSKTIDTSIPALDQPVINTQVFGLNISGSMDKTEAIVADVSDVTKEAANIATEVNEYSKDLQAIQKEGLNKSEKLPELAEQQASRLSEVQTIQKGESMSAEQIEMYKKAIEQYKNEQRIEEELKEKSKEIANDLILQNQGTVNESMKKIGKYKRKFPSVHDLRNLPARTPNPMKGLGWRERIVPGVTLQTLNSSELWLSFDPYVNYRITGKWSAGIGGIYRFTMKASKLTFDNFGSMYGLKIQTQYKVFNGFFLQAEGQHVTWKPWDTRLKDPDYKETVFVGVLGIGKSHMIARRIKGNIQSLYHYAWGSDPYRPKIMLRFGVEFSLVKREKPAWEQRLKDLKNCD